MEEELDKTPYPCLFVCLYYCFKTSTALHFVHASMKNVRNYSTGPGGSTLLYVVMDVTPWNLDIAVV